MPADGTNKGVAQIGMACTGSSGVGLRGDPAEMLRQDPPALSDDEGMGLAEMATVDQELGGRPLKVCAGIGHDAVGPAVAWRIAEVGDDRVVFRRPIDPQVAEGKQVRVPPRKLVDAGGKPLPEQVEEVTGSVTLKECLVGAARGRHAGRVAFRACGSAP